MLARPLFALLALLSLHALAAEGAEGQRQVIVKALAEAVTVPKQAEALARLAWTAEGPRDPVLQQMAREELVKFGEAGLPAIRQAIKTAPATFQADVVAALVGAKRAIRTGIPPEYLPSLEEAIWFGSIEAKRVAIKEICRYRYPPAVLSIIDAATEHRELRRAAYVALGRMADERARFFLGEALLEQPQPDRLEVARALAQIGAFDELRLAARSEQADLRHAAIEALLPVSGIDDLTVLHEFAAQHPGDDPQLVLRARERALYLETLLEKEAVEEPPSAGDPGP